MHKYQISSATVLPIATDDIDGNAESHNPAANESPSKASGSSTLERLVTTSVNSNSNCGVAFPPRAQTLQPIAGSQRNIIKLKAAEPAEASNGAVITGNNSESMLAAAFDGTAQNEAGANPTNSSTIPGAVAPEATEIQSQASAQSEEQPKVPLKSLRRATVEGGQIKPPRIQRKRSMSLQPAKATELTKNYDQLVREFNMLRPFTRCPDGSYPRDTKCVICRRARPSSVFFPCQHRSVCDGCINSHRISADRTNPSNWCTCPVCMADICLILTHSGKEEEKYWKWVMEVQPRLSSQFKVEFKETARRLEKGATTTASVTYESESPTRMQSNEHMEPRRHTWHPPNGSVGTLKPMRKSFRGSRDTSRGTCAIL